MQAHHLATLISLLSLTSTITAVAIPAPQWGGGEDSDPICTTAQRYTKTSQSAPFWAGPALAAGEQCQANFAGCSISDGKSFGIEVLITVGATLGLNIADIVGLGISGSVSVGKTTSQTITTGVTCPAECTCGLMVSAQMVTVTGTQQSYAHNSNGNDNQCVTDNGPLQPYSVNLPVIDPSAAQNNQAVTRFSACRVAHTFCTADPGLPLCPPA